MQNNVILRKKTKERPGSSVIFLFFHINEAKNLENICINTKQGSFLTKTFVLALNRGSFLTKTFVFIEFQPKTTKKGAIRPITGKRRQIHTQ